MICRSPAEAFQAGLDEHCVHDQTPSLCPACQLTHAEISVLAVLHRTSSPAITGKHSAPQAA
ncbi:hypothetical protein [Streptomyces sp. NPDC091416]|uniref:hypothetical protein n=1 Tax=Streptomyces sp. NPDC091416 TaxID=3366003 RepID=UPI003822B37D